MDNGISNSIGVIEIDEPNANKAMIRIYDCLKPYLESGWKGGNCYSLVDNYKNVYNLSKGTEYICLEFDLTKTIHRFVPKDGDFLNSQKILFSTLSPSLASEDASAVYDRIKARELEENPPLKNVIMDRVLHLAAVILATGLLVLAANLIGKLLNHL
jgi:hypothetical protein